MSEFSGPKSERLWNTINALTMMQGRDVLYEYGCKAQDMEASHKDLVKALKKYGHHSTPEICCEASLKEGGKCTCGFEVALAKAQPSNTLVEPVKNDESK